MESPDAASVTSWPRATSSSVSRLTTASVPPYAVGGTASQSGASCRILMTISGQAAGGEVVTVQDVRGTDVTPKRVARSAMADGDAVTVIPPFRELDNRLVRAERRSTART